MVRTVGASGRRGVAYHRRCHWGGNAMRTRVGVFLTAWLVVSLAVPTCVAAKATVTIATYSQPRFEILRDRLIPKWEAKHPDIGIEIANYPDFWNKLLVLMSTDQAPDIVDTAGTYIFGHVVRGGAVDLGPLLDKDATLRKESFWPGPFNEVRWPQPDGKGVYGLPYDTVGSVLWYSNELLRNAGVNPPSASWTWADLRLAARKIARDTDGDGQNDIWGLSVGASYEIFDSLVKSFGGRILQPDRRSAAIDSPQAIQATQFLADMALEDRSAVVGGSLAGANLGFQIGGSWLINTFARVEGLDFGTAMVPRGPVTHDIYGGSNMFEVMRRPGQDLQAVWAVLRELLTQETIEAFWTSYQAPYSIPSVRSVAARVKMNSIQQTLAQSVGYMSDADSSPDWAIWQNAKRAGIEPVLRGQRSAAEGVLRAAEEINKVFGNVYGTDR
jgi:multiple sugar transport system substrate-binding protein